MKEIKACIRPSRIKKLADALVRKGIRDITVVPVEKVGERRDQEHSRISLITHKLYSSSVKLEVVCRDEEVPEVIGLMQHVGWAGSEEKDVIFIMDITEVTDRFTQSTPLNHGKAL